MIMGLSKQWFATIVVAGVLVLVMMSAVGVWAAPKVWRRLVPPDPVSLSARAGSSASIAGTNGAASTNAPGAPNVAAQGVSGTQSGNTPPYAVATIPIRIAQN
jgi:hypothetical protein